MDQAESQAAVDAQIAAERALFETLGELVTRVTDDRHAVRLAGLSRHAAWRADQWAELARAPRPELSTTGLVDGTAPPAVDDHHGLSTWIEAVLAAAEARTEALLAAADPTSDGPIVRTAERVLHDIRLDQSR